MAQASKESTILIRATTG